MVCTLWTADGVARTVLLITCALLLCEVDWQKAFQGVGVVCEDLSTRVNSAEAASNTF